LIRSGRRRALLRGRSRGQPIPSLRSGSLRPGRRASAGRRPAEIRTAPSRDGTEPGGPLGQCSWTWKDCCRRGPPRRKAAGPRPTRRTPDSVSCFAL
jgi:hypothetical protein